jgi:feruloyl esterase
MTKNGRDKVTIILSFAAGTGAILFAAQINAAPCESLAALRLPETRIESSIATQPFAATDPMFGPFAVKDGFCRVTGTIAPAIKFEVWLPEPDAWNGKLQGVGNGGVAGSIAEGSLAQALARGYAGVSSDLGHEGGAIDFRFAVGHPELVRDWGYRATHAMTVTAKAIVAAFYGKTQSHAYFTGCSGGGRQGLMEAQRYPADYDGIVAGDPTADFTRLTLGGRLWEAIQTLKDPARYIPAAKIPAIAAAAVKACDALDGVKDGVIDDPRRCAFDPATIQCKAGDGEDCLTAPQVNALKAIYAGATDKKGARIFPGYQPGGEMGPAGWASHVSGDVAGHGSQFLYGGNFVRFMVMENPDYDPLSFDYDTDLPRAAAKLSPVIDATDPDLRAFAAHGGKMIQYHGWSDPGVAPESSVNYYERVARTLGKSPANFYRLFMVPGMQHCIGGPGPDRFDALAALERWVEQGEAPERIVVAHLTDGKADRTRPLCPYPLVARWNGTGSTDDAGSFACGD